MALPGHGKGGIYAEQSISKCNLTEQSVASPAGISAVFSTAHSIYLQEHTFCRRPLISNDLTSNILTLAPLIMTSHHTFAPVLTITGPRKKWGGVRKSGPKKKGEGGERVGPGGKGNEEPTESSPVPFAADGIAREDHEPFQRSRCSSTPLFEFCHEGRKLV